MMCFPSMLLEAATRAGMKVPDDPDNFNEKEFPHFHLYCITQLNRKIRWGEHWENAIVITNVPEVDLDKITLGELRAKVFEGL